VAVNLSSAAYNYTGGAGSVAAHTGQSFDGAGNDSAHVGTDTFTVSGADQVEWVWGSAFDDILVGRTTNGQTPEVFTGGAGDDFFDGNGGFDRAVYYYDETGGSGITVHLATGTVDSADEVTAANIGTDTLRSIDSVMGTNANDIYDATGFDASAVNLPDFFNSASPTPQGFNEFIGSGGDDTITGNGNTRAGYEFANGAVTVNLANGSGTADGDGSTGHDTFTGGVQAVIGSSFGDTIVGGGGGQRIQGFYGADNLTGGGGADQFEYGSAAEGLDTISDFTSGTDRFRIREAGFGIDDNTHTTANAFGGFTLNAGEFVTGTAATQANGQFIFDSTTNPSDHMLYWDADGTGAAAKVLIAHLGSATVAMSDFDLR
jgi:Ca2+-binding RTX toxin-like protein